MTHPLLRMLVLALGLLLCPLSGCTYSISPPDPLKEPVSVFVVDHGYHASLLLPRGDGSVAFYAYGRYDWFALNKDEFWRAPGAAFLPGEATLGRGMLPGPATYASVCERVPAEEILEVRVEAARVRALLLALDGRFDSGGEVVHNPVMGLDFVRDPEPYWLGHNCNAQIARWLEDLDCDVTGKSLDATFRVVHPHGPRGEPQEEFRP